MPTANTNRLPLRWADLLKQKENLKHILDRGSPGDEVAHLMPEACFQRTTFDALRGEEQLHGLGSDLDAVRGIFEQFSALGPQYFEPATDLFVVFHPDCRQKSGDRKNRALRAAFVLQRTKGVEVVDAECDSDILRGRLKGAKL